MSVQSLFSDGPPLLNWIKNDKFKFKYFYDESVFLCAIQVHSINTGITRWEFAVIEWTSDDELASMRYHGTNEYFDQWEWEDFSYFVLISGDMPSEEPPRED